MISVNYIGYFAVVMVLVAYIWSGRNFDWANVITCPVLAMVAGYHHSWPNMALSIAFGVIAVYRLWRFGL